MALVPEHHFPAEVLEIWVLHPSVAQRPHVRQCSRSRRRDHSRRHQMGVRARSLSSAKIAVGGRAAPLAGRHHIAIDADVHGAAGFAVLTLAGLATDRISVLAGFGAPQWIAGAYLGIGGGALALILGFYVAQLRFHSVRRKSSLASMNKAN